MHVTAKALWYIEAHSAGELSLEDIAAIAGVSRFHLAHAFRSATGLSVMQYVRARRLAAAAQALAHGAPDILAVALDAGYGSHEAFTRAFTQHYGVTPEQLRAQAHTLEIHQQEPLRMNPDSTAAPAPRLVDAETLRIFGLTAHHATNATIPAQWNRFVPWLGQFGAQKAPGTFGVIADAEEGCDYTTGIEVSTFPSQPAGFTRLTLPARRYAVFHHAGHVSTMAATWRDIWNRALPEAGLTPVAGAPSFERYGAAFDARTGEGGFEIWIPVEA